MLRLTKTASLIYRPAHTLPTAMFVRLKSSDSPSSPFGSDAPSGSPFGSQGPSPPRLPEEDQKEFEDAIKRATTQMAIDDYNEENGNEVEPEQRSYTTATVLKTVPEFEGNVNPKTGEVNGPKQDPTRHGDWAFNGRVTDF